MTILIMLGASKIYPRQHYFELEDQEYVNLEEWKYVKPVSALVILFAVAVYVIFSPLGII